MQAASEEEKMREDLMVQLSLLLLEVEVVLKLRLEENKTQKMPKMKPKME